jgi:hypothetical protein
LNIKEEALHVAGFEIGIYIAGGDVERIEICRASEDV